MYCEHIRGRIIMEWENLKIQGVGNIEKCVGEFRIQIKKNEINYYGKVLN